MATITKLLNFYIDSRVYEGEDYENMCERYGWDSKSEDAMLFYVCAWLSNNLLILFISLYINEEARCIQDLNPAEQELLFSKYIDDDVDHTDDPETGVQNYLDYFDYLCENCFAPNDLENCF